MQAAMAETLMHLQHAEREPAAAFSAASSHVELGHAQSQINTLRAVVRTTRTRLEEGGQLPIDNDLHINPGRALVQGFLGTTCTQTQRAMGDHAIPVQCARPYPSTHTTPHFRTFNAELEKAM